MFLRAQLSSQIASLTDFSTTILLGFLFGVYYVYATFIGAVCGGIVNCIINYKWTFKSNGCRKRYVAIKYMLVWVGSIGLNTSGTYIVTEWVKRLLDHPNDNIFIAAKLFVSLLVGFLWNYNMQRIFVYRNRDIKHFFIRRKVKESEDDN